MLKNCFFSLILLFFTNITHAQIVTDWCEIPNADLKMTAYPLDSAATSVVLQDVGSAFIDDTDKSYVVRFSRHRRIKVFDKSAFNDGNLLIPYYSYRRTEKVTSIEVFVFDENGLKTKVKSDNVFDEKINRYWSAKKVFIPNLQKGCIIEYRYYIEKNNIFSIPTWEFQGERPVRWSEYAIEIPQIFNYTMLSSANKPWDLDKTTSSKTTIPGYIGEITVTKRKFGMKEMPALKSEQYITTLRDYITKISFQLQRYTSQQLSPVEVFTTWEKLAADFEKEEQFGKQYNKTNHSKALWAAFQPLLKPGDSPEIIAEKARNFVSAQMTWDGEYRVYVPEKSNLDDVFAKKTGSSAELNLSIVALMRQAGIADAVPMLVSTREHGMPFQGYPFSDQFSSVLAYLPMGDNKGLLLDATNPFYPVNMIDEEHSNIAGWLVRKENSIWVDIKPAEMSEVYLVNMNLLENGTMEGEINMFLNGQNAVTARQKMKTDPTGLFLNKRFSTRFPESSIDSVVTKELDNLSKPFNAAFKATFPNAAQVANDFIYCSPIVDFAFLENPFKSPERLLPVNFPFPVKGQYVLSLMPPPGYKSEELPKSVSIILPNNGGKLNYACSSLPTGEVQITLRLNLTQTNYSVEEYDALRVFFDKMVEKTKEQIVFKKI